jgi:aminopeptidase N
MDQTIPSYLVSMAVGPYHRLQRTSNGIPVEWAALPVDTNSVLATFSNLDTTLSRYINGYGPYPFDKVGYCLVPFNSGAMEHASSIHIGRSFVNGTQTYATLWAHELAHMWWGDKVTCSTAEDMWLNEGFASYNEYYYTQFISGEMAYKNAVRTNHRKQLQFAHTPAGDGSYLAMNNVPHAYTYGTHVYNKGADLIHTLRNYMGDQAFFSGCQAYMTNLAYNSASSSDLRDQLTAGSSINMNRFFDDWIFTPGWPHFSIDSVVYQPGGLDHYWVYTRQRSVGNNHLYEMPLDITFSDGVIDTTVSVMIDSATNVFHIPIFFMARWVTMDLHEKVSDAIADNVKVVTATGIQAVNETNCSLNVQTLSTPSSVVRVEHNFVAPDPFKQSNPGIRLSDYHYWKVDGLFETGFLSKATFVYDGSTSGSTGFLDNTFITTTEDSMVILYREGTWDDWHLVSGFTHNAGPSATDKRGSFTVDTLKRGEYAMGIYDYTVGVNTTPIGTEQVMSIYPNPSGDTFRIQIPSDQKYYGTILIYDNGGREAARFVNCKPGDVVTWDPQHLPQGIYIVRFSGDKFISPSQKLLYAH